MSALAAAARTLLARWRPAQAGAALSLEQVLVLDGRRRLCLVRCAGRHVLLLTGGAADCVVGWMEAEPPA